MKETKEENEKLIAALNHILKRIGCPELDIKEIIEKSETEEIIKILKENK